MADPQPLKARPAPTDPESVTAVLTAVRQAADVICDRWSLTLILAAFMGATRYVDFAKLTGMADRLIAERLKTLEHLGLFSRELYSRRPLRHGYRLTPMGRQTFEIFRQMVRWQVNAKQAPEEAVLTWAAPLPENLACPACGQALTARDIDLRLVPGLLRQIPDKQVVRRRSTLPAGTGPLGLGPSLDIFGDKWGIEVLICAFMRLRRFSDMRAATGMAANILTDRLGRLSDLGLLAKSETGYRLTEKGIDLYGVTVAIQDWADAWLEPRFKSPVRLIHRGCGGVFSLPPVEPRQPGQNA